MTEGGEKVIPFLGRTYADCASTWSCRKLFEQIDKGQYDEEISSIKR
jgi:hypothetical protein